MTKNFEVVIAGGGLIGGAIALELALAGPRGGIYEQGDPRRESSWGGAGNLLPAPGKPATIPPVPPCKTRIALYPHFVFPVQGNFRARCRLPRQGNSGSALFSRRSARAEHPRRSPSRMGTASRSNQRRRRARARACAQP